jgi:hypothetical protein
VSAVPTLWERAIGAARLDAATYEDVEHDPSALGQALAIVVAASIGVGIGSVGYAADVDLAGLLLGVVANLVAWFAWAGVSWWVGTRLLPTPETEADLGQLLRTIGFSAAPGVVAVLGVLPAIGSALVFATWLWQLAAMVVAVRQALDYSSTLRALAVCAIGFLFYLAIGMGLTALLLVAGIGAPGEAATGAGGG